jgi:hypothetical protein
MTSKLLQTINDHLAKLHGFAYFRPQEGPLGERLSRVVLDAMPEEAELPHPLDLEVGIGKQEDESEATLELRVNGMELVKAPQVTLAALSDDELADLARYLAPIAEERAAEGRPAATASACIGENEAGHHTQGSAAARLKVAPEWLKSVIPCTDYSYEEIEGKKYIREYFWSKELIERLVKIRSTKTTPEDLQYVTKECCEGDIDWAKDLIARLKSPNRPEQAPREQQKGQARPAHPRQGQQGAARPSQMKAQQARQAATKAAPAKRAPVQPATGEAGAPAAANPAGVTPGGGEGERTRSRSRHRKPFRHHGKDAPRKPESPAGPKSSQ